MHIADVQSRETAHAQVNARLAADDGRGAITAAETVTADERWEWARRELLGVALIDGGMLEQDEGLIARGIDELRAAFPDPLPFTVYNVANGELGLWEIPLRRDGVTAALVNHRRHLHAARRAFESIGHSADAPVALRVQALVNAANSYDTLGRDLEALALWDQALMLDPDFAMAHGNRGIALAAAAPHAGVHAPRLVAQAIVALDRALADPQGVIAHGDPHALRSFAEQRARLPAELRASHAPKPAPWSDAYLEWCRTPELFLHVSHACLAEDTAPLDALFVHSISGDFGEAGERRGDDLLDGLNAIKQEYASVRYLTWLALDRDSTISSQAQALNAHVRLVDNANDARRGVRTGLAVQAFVAATNLLDKIAAYTHAYFDTGRIPKNVSFRHLWARRANKTVTMDPTLAAAMAPPQWNRGLAALCDLAADLEDDTPLSRFVALRHTATHRLLVAHDAEPPPSAGWLERIGWTELAQRSVEQLQLARAAAIYLVRAIDMHEHHKTAGESGVRLPLPTFDFDAELTELD